MTQVFFTQPGHRDLERLDTETRDRVKRKLQDVEDDTGRYLRRLRGHDLYVLRVGDHRVIADWDRVEGVVYVHAIAHRRNVYDREL